MVARLLGYIDKCSAPCVGRIGVEEYRALAEDFCAFMAGETGRFLRQLEAEMKQAAAAQEYERAARIRDDIQALRTVMEKQAVVLGDSTDCDVIAIAEDQLEAAVQVFYVRGGRIRGERGWVVDKVEDVSTGKLVEQFLAQTYGGADDEESTTAIPREVLVSAEPADRDAVVAWLSKRRGAAVDVRVPQRGDKRALMETVLKNAEQTLARHKSQRASDLTTRSKALAEIAEALGLAEAPLRIECFDISTLQGEHTVASMVVFEDGLARKSEYRRFSIRGAEGADSDVAAMYEVISRRFTRYLRRSQRVGELDTLGESGAPQGAERKAPRFAYPPNLVVVDGGRPQVAAAQRALDDLGIEDVAVCGLAKRLEEVWLPGEEDPIILPRTSEGLYLLQRVRDEAHRFAISYHRRKRAKALTASVLDDIPGLGPVRRAALLKHFGSVRRLAQATAAEIAEVPGIGERTAQTIYERLTSVEGGQRTQPENSKADE